MYYKYTIYIGQFSKTKNSEKLRTIVKPKNNILTNVLFSSEQKIDLQELFLLTFVMSSYSLFMVFPLSLLSLRNNQGLNLSNCVNTCTSVPELNGSLNPISTC